MSFSFASRSLNPMDNFTNGRPVTVPGAGYTHVDPSALQHRYGSPTLIALEIARALELEAYAAYRRAFHTHKRRNTADSAAEADAAMTALLGAQGARDDAEATHQ